MFKKMNYKVLIILLVVLGALWAISEMCGDNERTFKSEIIDVDTTDVSSIVVVTPKSKEDIVLKRQGNDWLLTSGGKKYNADPGIAKRIISQLNELKPERVAATSEDNWGKYEVTDTAATRVKLMDNGKELADIYVGKFSYSQPPQNQGMPQMQRQQAKMTTYVRNAGEDEVYAVDGFLKMTLQADVNGYRNKFLVNANKDNINRISFDYPDQDFTAAKQDGRWVINGTMPADSTKMVRYLNKLSRTSSNHFVDNVDKPEQGTPYQVTIEGNNFNPIEVRAFPADTINQYLITSTQNRGAWFSGSKSNIFERIYTSEEALLPDEEEQK